jgi:hypothetical protein
LYGAPFIERVDLLVKLISYQLGMPNAEIDRTVQVVDQKLNEKIVAADPAHRDMLHRSSRMAHPTCRHFRQ